MAKGKNGIENLPQSKPQQPVNDFDKFVQSALDGVVTSLPDRRGDMMKDTVLSDAKGGVVSSVDQSPSAIVGHKDYVSTPSTTNSMQQPTRLSETLNMTMEQRAQGAYHDMLREEESRIAARNNSQSQPHAPQPYVPPNQNTTINPQDKVRKVISLEEQTMASYRATLRQDEERLAQQPKAPPLPPMPGIDGIAGIAYTHHSAKEPILRDDVNPLATQAYLLLRRLVAGQYVIAYGPIYHETQQLLATMKNELEKGS